MFEKVSFSLLILLGVVQVVFADPDGAVKTVSAGNTGFMQVCAAMVTLMTPAVALFYSGMVRTKNVLNTIMQCVFIMGLITVQWALLGYSPAFASDVRHIVGNLDFAGLRNVGLAPSDPSYAVYDIPMYVCSVDMRTDIGIFCRKDEISCVCAVYIYMDNVCIRSCSPLGMGRRWLDGQVGGAGFRRRYSCAYSVRGFRPCGRSYAW